MLSAEQGKVIDFLFIYIGGNLEAKGEERDRKWGVKSTQKCSDVPRASAVQKEHPATRGCDCAGTSLGHRAPSNTTLSVPGHLWSGTQALHGEV